jgi:hypothetical protein
VFGENSEIVLVLVVVLVLEGCVLAGWSSSILRVHSCLRSRSSASIDRRKYNTFEDEDDDEDEDERGRSPTFPV